MLNLEIITVLNENVLIEVIEEKNKKEETKLFLQKVIINNKDDELNANFGKGKIIKVDSVYFNKKDNTTYQCIKEGVIAFFDNSKYIKELRTFKYNYKKYIILPIKNILFIELEKNVD